MPEKGQRSRGKKSRKRGGGEKVSSKHVQRTPTIISSKMGIQLASFIPIVT